VVGEASSREKLGDVIKNGRRGSLGGELRIHGVQGHVAYPQKADNPIHKSLAALDEIKNTEWDKGNEFFQPTSFQISNIHSGTGATNVIPGFIDVMFNFRYSTESTAEELQSRLESILNKHQLKFDLKWILSGKPFLTAKGKLVDAVKNSISEVCNIDTELSTEGGTSDGRFIAPTGAEVVELGPCNETIHKINECVRVEDLDTLSEIYERILERLLA